MATIRLGDRASSKVYIGAPIQPMSVFPTNVIASDTNTDNIKIIANGHDFNDMDIVYIPINAVPYLFFSSNYL